MSGPSMRDDEEVIVVGAALAIGAVGVPIARASLADIMGDVLRVMIDALPQEERARTFRSLCAALPQWEPASIAAAIRVATWRPT